MCKKCGTPNRIQIRRRTEKLKSNVDVFIATELLEIAHSVKKPVHLILMACDGDYVEVIKTACKNPHVHVTVLATPTTRKNNALSIRLKLLRRELPENYLLRSIIEIKDLIS